MRIFSLAAISTTAIAAPAPAAAPAKTNANDASAASSPFATVLAATNNQQPAPAASPSSNDKSSSNSDKDDAASAGPGDASNSSAQANVSAANATSTQTADAAQTEAAARAQLQADAADDIQDGAQPAGKPAAKDSKTTNDNQVPGMQASGAAQPQPAAAQPDANLIAMAQATQLAAQAPQQPAANDEGGDAEETGAVSAAGKPGAKPASAGQGQFDAASAANDSAAASPAAAAQAAIQGASANGNSSNGNSNSSGDNAGNTDKPATKTADSAGAPQVQPQPQQPGQPQSPAPSMNTAAIPAMTNGMPVQTSNAAHNVAAAVQVAPQAAATPDVNGLAVEIAARSQSGAKQFQIRLDPPELGRVDVRLSIDATGKTEAHLTADRPETLNLLQKDSGTLTQALRNSGLDVSQSRLNFSLRDQNSQAGNDNGGQRPRTSLAATRVLDAAQSATSISFTGGADQTRLDIHV